MDDKDVIIAQLMAENQQLRVVNQSLREEIDRLKKNSDNSSKPPSSDIVKPPKSRGRDKKKRQRGGQKGHKKFERPEFKPEQIARPLKMNCETKTLKGSSLWMSGLSFNRSNFRKKCLPSPNIALANTWTH